MSKRHAQIENGTVVNVIMWDGTPCSEETPNGWTPPEGQQAVEIPDGTPVAISWLWNGSTFAPPT